VTNAVRSTRGRSSVAILDGPIFRPALQSLRLHTTERPNSFRIHRIVRINFPFGLPSSPYRKKQSFFARRHLPTSPVFDHKFQALLFSFSQHGQAPSSPLQAKHSSRTLAPVAPCKNSGSWLRSAHNAASPPAASVSSCLPSRACPITFGAGGRHPLPTVTGATDPAPSSRRSTGPPIIFASTAPSRRPIRAMFSGELHKL